MLWFEGSVSEAIAESKRINSVFVVYIRGDDEETKKMDLVWNDPQINVICSKDCTAVKLHVNSVEGQQFVSVYPVICIPCTFFIGGDGQPLEGIVGSLSAEQFLEKAKETIQKHHIKFPRIERESSPNTSTSPSISTSPLPPSQSDEPVGERSDSNAALTERVSRAKKLIEEKKRDRQEKEKEDVERKEIERRKEGQRISKAKVEREEKLAQQMAERVKIEKAKTKAAHEAIRQKIAQDRAERAAREEMERKERHDIASRINPHINTNNSNVQCSNVRLQFRLHDGSSVTENFPPDSTLETARQFICSKMNFKKSVTFWTTFPRKHFGDEEFSKTLSDLGLAPSAALVVDISSGNLSRHSGDSANSSILSAITWVLAPLLALLSFFKWFLFATPQQAQRSTQETSTQSSSQTNASGSSPPTSEVRQRTKNSGKKEDNFKTEGKVHSFRQNDSSDDDNNTWNGNSTQQM